MSSIPQSVRAVVGGNPYDYRSPIRVSDRFFGRSAQLDYCRETITKKACLSLVGESRCGLTSLLYRLLAQDFQELCEASAGHLVFIHVDCTSFDDPLPLVCYLLTQIIPDRPVPKLPNWRPAFGRLIAALDSLERERTVILFDDFEWIGANERFVEFTDRFRALTPRTDMTLITATHTELKRCCHKRIASSPFPNMFQVKYVGSFSQEEASAFLRATSAISGLDLLAYSEHILDLGGRLPYFLQMACWHYHEALAKGGEPDHKAIAEGFAREAHPDFDRIWERLDESRKKAIRGFLGGRPLSKACKDLIDKGYIVDDHVFSSAFCSYVAGTK